MKPLTAAVAVAVLCLSCATSRPASTPAAPFVEGRRSGITAMTFSASGEKLLFSRESQSACDVESVAPGGAAALVAHVDLCPDRMTELTGGQLFLGRKGAGAILGSQSSDELVDAAADARLVKRGGDLFLLVGAGEKNVGPAAGLRDIRVLPRTGAVVGVRLDMSGERLVRLDTPVNLSDPADEIESWDFSPDEKEVVFSARKAGDYKVAISNLSESKVRWLPADSQPERHVSWAPRGHKVSYVIERPEGSFIRTVHLPTGFQLTVPFASSSVRSITWEPKAERFAVVVSSPMFSPRIDWLKYGGEQRQQLVASSELLQGEADSLSWSGGTAVLIRPTTVRYSAKSPLVVWVGATDPLAWSAARAVLRNTTDVGQIVVPARTTASADFWSELQKLPWIDPARISVVLLSPQPTDSLRAIPAAAAVLLSEADAPAAAGILPLKRLRRVTADRSDVESAAAREIATHLGRPQKH